MKIIYLLISILLLLNPSLLFAQGTVSTQSIASSILNRNVAYNVYVPPSYNQNTDVKYHVLYLLHGYFGNNTDWTNNGMAATMNTEIGNGAKEMIVIMPEGLDAFYCNNFDGRKLLYEDFMLQELIPQVESKYRINSSKQNRAIAGLSMGGYGATYHAFKYADMYSSSYNMSGAVLYGAGEPNLKTLLESMSATELKNLPPYTIEIGTGDFLFNNNLIWHNLLLTKGVTHTYITRAGVHDWPFWNACLPKAIRFASDNFGTTNGVADFVSGNKFIRFYPNPVKDKFVIESPVITGKSQVSIFNVGGRKLSEQKITGDKREIDISNLPAGIYIIKLINEQKIITGKIIKK